MTEPEAYRAIGWPMQGGLGTKQPFVLPLSGSDRRDWIAAICSNRNCGGRGVLLPEAFTGACPLCGTPYADL